MYLFVKCYVAIKYRQRALPAKILGMHAFEAKNGDARLAELRQHSCSLCLSHSHARAHSIGRKAQKRDGGQVKMEKVLGLAMVSSILCVGSVLGKYVRGIVNTKEVSIMFTFYCCCAGNGSEFSGVLAAHLLVAVIDGLLWQLFTPPRSRASGSLML